MVRGLVSSFGGSNLVMSKEGGGSVPSPDGEGRKAVGASALSLSATSWGEADCTPDQGEFAHMAVGYGFALSDPKVSRFFS